MKFKHLIYYIAINLWSLGKFASIENIRRKCNPVVDLTKLIKINPTWSLNKSNYDLIKIKEPNMTK